MDYRNTDLGFRVRKVLRYVGLYGPSRTLEKVRAHRHMTRVYAGVGSAGQGTGDAGRIGLIGCGAFAYSTIVYYLRREGRRGIRATMDTNPNRARSLAERAKACYWTTDAQRLIDDDDIALVFVASNHSTHAPYAVAALNRGKHVHIEKPVAVDEAQLRALVRAMRNSTGGVQPGFNRPVSRLGRLLLQALEREHGPAVVNWFVVGHAIPADHWYFDPAEGGRVLGNICHWIDFLYLAIPSDERWPVRIIPTRGARPDCNVVVSYAFRGGSVGVISFVEMDNFEGVRERCSAQKGHTLIALDDFKTLVVDVGEKKKGVTLRYRDHGHQEAVRRSLGLLDAGKAGGVTPEYVWETGLLTLRTKEALELGREVVVDAPREYRDLEV
jgi:hypothetical protein